MATFLDAAARAERSLAADNELSSYGFGDGVTVVAHGNWNSDDPADFTKIVYVAYDDDQPEADSHKVSFHVRFDATGEIEDVYALEMEHGNELGARGARVSSAAERPLKP